MITKEFVLIPVRRPGFMQIVIGSVRINPDGEMTFVISGGTDFAKKIQNDFRNGKVEAMLVHAVPADACLLA